MASYTKLLTNHGDAFDIESGIFTCPRAGVYHFSSAATRWFAAGHRMSVMKNKTSQLHFKSCTYRLDSTISSDNDGDDVMMM